MSKLELVATWSEMSMGFLLVACSFLAAAAAPAAAFLSGSALSLAIACLLVALSGKIKKKKKPLQKRPLERIGSTVGLQRYLGGVGV